MGSIAALNRGVDRQLSASFRRQWRPSIALAGSALFAIAGAVFIPQSFDSRRPPLELAVRQDQGQIVVRWRHDAAQYGAALQIADGSQRIAVFIHPEINSLTYRPQTADIEIRMARWGDWTPEIARCITKTQLLPGSLEAQFSISRREAEWLHSQLEGNLQHLAELQGAADRLFEFAPARNTLARQKKIEPQVARWWRD